MSLYSDKIIADGATGYWRMNEASGSLADAAVTNKIALSLVGAVAYSQPGLISKDPDGAIRLPVSPGGYFSGASNAKFDLGDVFTIEAWVKRIQGTGDGMLAIVSKGNSAYYLRITTANQLQLVKSFTSNIVSSTTTITDTNVHHVVATKNGATVKLYIDGVDVTGAVTNAVCANNTNAFLIGSDRGAELTNLTIDEVAIYPTALSAAVILSHYNLGTAVVVTSPITLAATLSAAPVLKKFLQPAPKNANLVLTPVANRRLSKPLASTLTAGSVVTAKQMKFMTLPAVLVTGPVFSVKRSLKLTLGGSVSLSAAQTLRKYALVPLNASTGLSVALGRRLDKPLAALASMNPALTNPTPLKLSAVVSAISNISLKSGSLVKLNLSAFPGISAALGFSRTQVRKFFVEIGMVEPVLLSASFNAPEIEAAAPSAIPVILQTAVKTEVLVSVPGVEKPAIEKVS